ncbi:hypothetical protein EJ08DRAFT_695737 [Tothia fuscella]|uniref:Sld7 C-terminal domain-containing protein n=1 Tax=Tothia fuscella TaxID=1048955 RepID=A0A9P4NVX0_9PEZI|nr:hypothetical protein EJ08DRAFT_695737 [Tothia fuscella]
MHNTTTVSLQVDDSVLEDIQICSSSSNGHKLDFGSELQFLSLVEVAQIPLWLAAGPACNIFTASEQSAEWFSEQLLFPQHADRDTQSTHAEWWQMNSQQSHLGILAKASSTEPTSVITEVLFYGIVDNISSGRDPLTPPPSSPNGQDATSTMQVPSIRVQALPLSSHFLNHLPSPPASPPRAASGKSDARFLPSVEELRATAEEVEKKRKRVSDVFDEADETRRKARRKGGSGVAAAASKVEGITTLFGQKKPKAITELQSSTTFKSTESQNPRIKHVKHPSISGIESPLDIGQKRPLSRSPSISSDTRPGSRRGLLDSQSKRSSLSRITSLSEAATIEDRNKEVISRVVMAGMRLYGLQQRKKPTHARRDSEVAAASAASAVSDEVAKDDEYKLIYYQTYKGTVFAFRKHITTETLYLTPEPLRETVDRLLAIFCSDPIVPS